MKFLNLLSISMATAVAAVPLFEYSFNTRGIALNNLNTAFSAAKSSINNNFAAINVAINGLNRTTMGLTPAARNLIVADLKNIDRGLVAVAGALTNTTGTFRNLALTAPKNLTYAELEQVKLAFSQSEDIVSTLKAGAKNIAGSFTKGLDAAVKGEINAVLKTAGTFTGPLQGLLDATTNVAKTNVQASGFAFVERQILPLIKTLVAAI